MSRVLVTGAGGFIGTAALESLAYGEHEVHAVSSRLRASDADVTWHVADLLAHDVAEDLVATVRPELLLHLA